MNYYWLKTIRCTMWLQDSRYRCIKKNCTNTVFLRHLKMMINFWSWLILSNSICKIKFPNPDIFTGTQLYLFFCVSFLKWRPEETAACFLPGMTEQSSTPSATAFGLSEGALEGWKNNKVWSLALLQHFSLHLSQCFKQKEKFVRMLGVAFLFFHLSLLQSLCEAIFRHTLRLSSELNRGMPKQSSSGTHSSSDERAERKGLTRQRRDGFRFEANIRPLSLVVLHSPPSSTPQPALKHHIKLLKRFKCHIYSLAFFMLAKN